jgi:PqqD family protein of HPr-rel-A system
MDGIRVLAFDDESVIFNPVSWDAHLLNAAAAAVLEFLDRPRGFAEIEQLLREALLEAQQPDAAAHARHLLEQFEQLGLVRRVKEQTFAPR